MNEKTLASIDALLAAMKNDPRILRLEGAEKAMSEDEEARALSLTMKEKERVYEEALRYRGEAKDEQHELYLAKKALDENPLARDYLAAYQEVRRLYAEIDGIIFGPYRSHFVCGGKHA